MRPEFASAQRGFGLVAAMFLIVVIAGVIAAMTRMAITQNATTSLALQQARAYQAARAGLEWGISQAVTSAVSKCELQAPFLVDGFSVQVGCTEASSEDEGKTLFFYTLNSTAEDAVPGSPDYIYRKLYAVVEK